MIGKTKAENAGEPAQLLLSLLRVSAFCPCDFDCVRQVAKDRDGPRRIEIVAHLLNEAVLVARGIETRLRGFGWSGCGHGEVGGKGCSRDQCSRVILKLAAVVVPRD